MKIIKSLLCKYTQTKHSLHRFVRRDIDVNELLKWVRNGPYSVVERYYLLLPINSTSGHLCCYMQFQLQSNSAKENLNKSNSQ